MKQENPIQYSAREDIPALLILINGAYRGEGSKKGWTTEADLLGGSRIDTESLEQLLNIPGSIMLKYTNEEKGIVGCVHLQKNGTKLLLGMLAVQPEQQGEGIGKALLSASEKYGRLSGCDSILITVISIRKELVAWYMRHGFIGTGETIPFPSDPKFGIPRQELVFTVMIKNLL